MWAPPASPFFLPPFFLPTYLVTVPWGREATQAVPPPMAAALPRGHRRCAPRRLKSPSTVHPSAPGNLWHRPIKRAVPASPYTAPPLGISPPKSAAAPCLEAPWVFLLAASQSRGGGEGGGVEERERGEPEAALGELEAVALLDHQVAVRPAGEAT
jgi:hypothetical protein